MSKSRRTADSNTSLFPIASMAPSTTPGSSSPPSISKDGESSLQPFFVLHKALPQKSDVKPSRSKTIRKIDLSPVSPKSARISKDIERVEENIDHHYEQLRIEAFDLVWSKIEITINEVLRDININVFNEIHEWVRKSFSVIRSTGTPSFLEVNCSYPLVTDITCKQIFTGLVFTKNVEFVDDLLTFKELGMHLKSHGCHVVNLSSIDFSAKNGIGGCLKSVLRQLVMVSPDAADISILASWYSEPENYDNPLVVIIEDMERCCGSVFSEFILMLREWVVKIPIILVMGVATTIDAPRNVLPSNALQCLHVCKFTLGSPSERLDSIIVAILLKPCAGFDISFKVAVFLRNYFIRQDGTVTSFIRALKIACAKHFLMEPLSFLCKDLLEEDSKSFWVEKCTLFPETMLKYAFDLPSCESRDKTTITGESLVLGLSEIKELRKDWSSVFLCLYEASKFHKMQLFDIFCEALDPSLCNLRASSKHHLGVGKDLAKPSSTDHKGGLICQVVRKLSDLSTASLRQLLQFWRKHTKEIAEIHSEVNELHSILKCEVENKGLGGDGTGTPKKPISRGRLNIEKDTRTVNVKVAMLLERMVRDYIKPIECAPFHEIFCFKHVDVLQAALIGDPRRTIQVDLLKSHNYFRCSCCTKGGNILPSMHDTSIMYTLAQEHGDLINLHDWFESFKSVLCPSIKGKRKIQSPSSKKRKDTSKSEDVNEASVQARFCKAVTELQITGLLRMPSKRRPDYVQRVAFGL